MSLRILHISDSHLHPLEEILDGYEADILIHSGDALIEGSLAEGHKFLEDWKRATKRFKYKIFSPGNHDISYGDDNFYWKSLFYEVQTQFLDTEGCFIDDIFFWGHTRVPIISSGYWYGESSEIERRRALSYVPNENKEIVNLYDRLVMISHGPPLGEIDQCQFFNLAKGENELGPNWGCEELRKFLYDRNPPVLACLSGHLHSAREVNGGPIKYMKTLHGQTLISNASICDESYKPVFKPVVIEL